METVIVDFVGIQTAIDKILENTKKIKEQKVALETLVTSLSEDWKDTMYNSYDLYKESTFGLGKDIEQSAVDIDALVELIKTSMQAYKENEDSGEQIIRSVEF